MPSIKTLLVSSTILYLSAIVMMKLYMILAGKGFGVTVFNHYPGECRVIPNLECGSEDVAVTKDGLAFISNGFRGLTGCDRKTITGNIYLFDYKNPSANVTKVEIISTSIDLKEFEPHGLSVWEDGEGVVFLFAVDHGVSERVQLFEYRRNNPGRLQHKETIMHEKFICLNDLVALGKSSFYITNFLKYCKTAHIALMLESQLALPTGDVVYYDGGDAAVVGSGLKMPNGVNLSPDRRHLYVTASSQESLLVYKRNEQNGSIELVREFPLHTAVDNVEVDLDTGDLYIGAHRSYRLLLEDYNGTQPAPSHVLRIRPTDEKWSDAVVTEILSSDGFNFVRGSSVASFYKGGLLVGTVYHRLAYCQDVNIL